MRICPQCGAETTALTCRHDGFGTVDAARYRRFDPTQLLGTLFQDRYRVDAVLGSGGMGSVYRATQVRVGRQVALKVINAELAFDLAVVARFQREGRAIASLIHPNIVQVYDFGQTEDGQLFMAMELVAGKTLADLVREEAPLDPNRVVHIGAQIFDALAEAHEHGVVHRDLKPENIFVTETGRRRDVVKVLDFGVAKIVNEPKSESMVTARGAILGSPKYMAPEQARGKGVTGHADLYATGGILYELLTGQPVFNEPSPADYLVAHSVKMPTPPSVNGRELRGPLVDLIMKCLEKKPWNRPDGAPRALEALEGCRLLPVIEPGDSPPVVVREIPSRGDATSRRLVRPVTPPDGTERPPALPPAAVAEAAARAVAVPPPLRPHEMTAPTPPTPPPLDSAGDDEDDDDRRPRVVAPGIVRVAERQKTATEPPAEAVRSVDTRRFGTRAAMVAAVDEAQAAPAPAPVVETKAPTAPAVQAVIASGAQVEQTQEAEAVLASVTTHGDMRIVGPAARETRRSGAMWLLIAAAVLFVGAFAVLAANNLFGHEATGEGGEPASAALRHAETVPVQPAGMGPAAPGADVGVALGVGPGGEAGPGPGAGGLVGEQGPGEGPGAAPADGPDAASAAAAASADTAVGSSASAADTAPSAREAKRLAEAEAARKAERDAAAKAGAVKDDGRRTADGGTKAVVSKDPLGDLGEIEGPAGPDEAGQLRRVLVDTVPSGAEVRMGALLLGRTPVRVEWKEAGQPVVVTLTKEGFHPYHATLSPAQAGLSAKLKPLVMEAPPGPAGP